MSALRTPLLLSIAAALLTVALKGSAYAVTGSVGLLSDAMESLINLVASLTAYGALWYSAKPVDTSHTYGHEKIEYLASGLEGVLILVAALGIGWLAVSRMLTPQPLEPLGLGLALSVVAAAINGVVGMILLRAGKRHGSIVLEADGKHLLTDVWTSAGVVLGLGLVALTNLEILDPIVALVMAVNILWTGVDLIRRSFDGLMDHALPEAEQEQLRRAIEPLLGPHMAYHALRTRRAGTRRFADFHLLVPGDMSVQVAHELGDRIEAAIASVLPKIEVTVHVEPIEASQSWHDSELLALEKLATDEHR